MAAGTKRRILQRDPTRRHSLHRKLSGMVGFLYSLLQLTNCAK
jgi:hypothetical protein